jgi:prepilin-type N-terminal cleavage/methylation domain-containing protein
MTTRRQRSRHAARASCPAVTAASIIPEPEAPGDKTRSTGIWGFTLVELIVVMTVVTVILAASVVLMHFVLQLDGEVHQRTYTVTMVGRLADQFRRDVHQARGEPVIAKDHRSAEIHLAGGRIVKWQVDELHKLVRTEQAHGSAEASAGNGPTNREDTFTLPKGTLATMELQSQGAARFATIRLVSPGAGGPSLTIEALASRDERLAVQEEKP